MPLIPKAEEKDTVKEKKRVQTFNLDDIIKEARTSFTGGEKGLGLQITSGAKVFRPSKPTDFVVSSCPHWKQLTGIPGIPFGSVIQIAGRPDSGKSSHGMSFMADAQNFDLQQQDILVVFWDSEKKFSPTRFTKFFNGKAEDLAIIQSKMILEGGDEVKAVIQSALKTYPKLKVLFVWDSVGGTLPKNEGDENDLRDGKQMAAASKENGQVIRSIVRLMEEYKNKETNEERLGVLLVNQSYANIGAPGQKESGGQKVEYHSSLILQLTRKKDLTKTRDKVKRKIGIVTRAKVKKNHLFDGEDSVAELDLLITAGGIRLASDAKLKTEDGWDSSEDGDVEELD